MFAVAVAETLRLNSIRMCLSYIRGQVGAITRRGTATSEIACPHTTRCASNHNAGLGTERFAFALRAPTTIDSASRQARAAAGEKDGSHRRRSVGTTVRSISRNATPIENRVLAATEEQTQVFACCYLSRGENLLNAGIDLDEKGLAFTRRSSDTLQRRGALHPPHILTVQSSLLRRSDVYYEQ